MNDYFPMDFSRIYLDYKDFTKYQKKKNDNFLNQMKMKKKKKIKILI